jgi:two-component sensor histidine kinase
MAESFTLELPVDSSTPKAARNAVSQRFGAETRCGDLLLCVSEVVTNAIRHARTPSRMTVTRESDLVRVEVLDASEALPELQPLDLRSSSGRGLQIVDRLAHKWGSEHTANGKVVWFELDLRAAT